MRSRFVLCTGLLAGLLVASPASAATTQIGAVPEIDANQPPATTPGGLLVQVETDASRNYDVPTGFGVVTAWRHRTGPVSGPLTFKVYRPTVDPTEFLTVGADAQSVTAGQNHRFDVRIPVQPGDLIGLSTLSDVHVAYDTNDADDIIGAFDSSNDPPVGSVAVTGGGPEEYRLNVAAVLESDADGDGYGDDTQDTCPTDPARQDCVLPESTLDKKPKRTIKTTKSKVKVKFAFSSNEAGATFRCKIDKTPFKACTSPVKKKFKPGKHKFAVQAVDAAGNLDGTPAKAKFTVKRIQR